MTIAMANFLLLHTLISMSILAYVVFKFFFKLRSILTKATKHQLSRKHLINVV